MSNCGISPTHARPPPPALAPPDNRQSSEGRTEIYGHSLELDLLDAHSVARMDEAGGNDAVARFPFEIDDEVARPSSQLCHSEKPPVRRQEMKP